MDDLELKIEEEKVQEVKAYSERKFVLALIGLGVMGLSAAACAAIPVLKELFSSLVSGILGVVAIYSGASVADGFIAKKTASTEAIAKVEKKG